MQESNILIIGAGPAGLAVAGRLHHQGSQDDYVIIDEQQHVGHSWRHHYDRLHLHTVKQWSNLPHLEFPKEYPLYVPRAQVVEYLQNYADHFDIRPQFGTKVERISRHDQKWLIHSNQGDILTNHVIVACGVNRIPKVPSWTNQDNFHGDIIHSRYYKNPKPYLGKKTLVVGFGNTGSEIALDLANHGVETYISVRSPVSVVPRDLNGRPVQVTAKAMEKLPFGLGSWLGNQIRRVYFGDLTKYGLDMIKIPPAQLLKQTGKTPMIDIGTINLIKKGKIKVVPDIDQFTADGVITKAGDNIRLDKVILGTGYRAGIPSLIPGIETILNGEGLPAAPVSPAPWQGLYFIGYDNYKLGGILGTIRDDSATIVDHILN